jgi:predicted DNA-binding ribbon-helix-helix protein
VKSPNAKSSVLKRTIYVAGCQTGISLEPQFWEALKEIAKERGSTVGALVTGINADRRNPNLSSAIRLFVLDHCQEQFATLKGRKPSA